MTPTQPHRLEGGMAWLKPGAPGLGFGNLAGEKMAVLMATAPPPLNFLSHGKSHGPDVMGSQAVFGLWARG